MTKLSESGVLPDYKLRSRNESAVLLLSTAATLPYLTSAGPAVSAAQRSESRLLPDYRLRSQNENAALLRPSAEILPYLAPAGPALSAAQWAAAPETMAHGVSLAFAPSYAGLGGRVAAAPVSGPLGTMVTNAAPLTSAVIAAPPSAPGPAAAPGQSGTGVAVAVSTPDVVGGTYAAAGMLTNAYSNHGSSGVALPARAAAAEPLLSGATVQSVYAPMHQFTFTGDPIQVNGGGGSFYMQTPSVLYHNYGVGFSTSLSGISISGTAFVAAGLKGGIYIGPGYIAPSFPVTINPNAPPGVLDGSILVVDPTLVSTDDASFTLGLATAAAALTLKLGAFFSTTLSTPQFKVGFTVPSVSAFGVTIVPSFFVGFTIPSQTLTLGPISLTTPPVQFTLPTSGVLSADAWQLQLSQLTSTTVNSDTLSAWGSLPTLSAKGQTSPFIVGQLDLIQALLGKSDPFQKDFEADGVKVSLTGLSVPASLSLNLGDSVTLKPTGITETLTDPLNGETRSGPLGTAFSFDAPASGAGTIDLQASYTLNLAVSSALGLYGSMSLALAGPQANVNFEGLGPPGIGPIFNAFFFKKSGELAQLNSWNFNTALTSTGTISVPYSGVSSVQTVSAASGAVTLNALGTQLTITPTGTITSAGYGVSAGKGVFIDNSGGITAVGNGIYLANGGVVRNFAGAQIVHGGTSSLTAVGIDSPVAPSSQIYNAGTISGFINGIYAAGGAVTNDAGGLITAAGGIVIATSIANVINAGSIAAGTGISLLKGGSVYQPSTGVITAHGTAIAAGGYLTLRNKGTITARIDAIYAQSGANVTNFAGGVISTSLNAGLRLSAGPVTLVNAGTISGFNQAAVLSGTSNLLEIAPGAVFGEPVQASGTGANRIVLLSGSSVGTLTGLGAKYYGFGSVTVAPGAAWSMTGGTAGFAGVTLTGLTPADTLDLTDLPFAAGESAVVNTVSKVLTIYGPTRNSIVNTLQLSGTIGFPQFAVTSDGTTGTMLAELTGSNSIVGKNPGVQLGTASRYGTVLNVLYTAGNATNAANGITAQDLPATIRNAGTLVGSGTAAGMGYGISLADGGTIVNGAVNWTYLSPASIFGVEGGVKLGTGASKLYNLSGTITSQYSYAVSGSNSASRIFNGASAVISGAYGIGLNNGGLVRNDGVIKAFSKAGVRLMQGGTVANYGTILGLSASLSGVYVYGGTGSLVNHGAILFGTSSFAGVDMRGGGNVYNAGGTIMGGVYGVHIYGGSKIDNFGGTIFGVTSDSDGSILNQHGTILAANFFGIKVAKKGNFGTIHVTNAMGGIVAGIYSTDSTTITNDGTSTINGYGIQATTRGTDPSILAVSNAGLVKATGQWNSIVAGVWLGSTGSVTNQAGGTIMSAGTTAVGNYGIIGGSLPIGITNFGYIYGFTDGVAFGAAPGTLDNFGTIGGGAGGIAVAFGSGAGDRLVIEPGSTLKGGVANFAHGDTIDFAGLSETIQGFAVNKLTLTGAANITLGLTGSFTAGQLRISTDAAGGSQVTVACFASGTRILTAAGEVPVEALRVGEALAAVHRGRLSRVLWLGHRHIDCLRHRRPSDVWPVRVAAGAFADDLPHRDLWLSPEHAVLLRVGPESVLVPIRHLMNGTTIAQIPRASIMYWHVELSHHDAILAEGLPCETYLDTGNRSDFANGGPVIPVSPNFAATVWNARACAAQLRSGGALISIQRRLLQRAHILREKASASSALHSW